MDLQAGQFSWPAVALSCGYRRPCRVSACVELPPPHILADAVARRSL